MIRRFAAPLCWAALIFISSSVPGDSLPSPGLPHLDKVAHAAGYAVLAWLLARAMGAATRTGLIAATLIATLWGVTDEVHQTFVPGRDPDVRDAIADTLGALCGALVWKAATRSRSGRS